MRCAIAGCVAVVCFVGGCNRRVFAYVEPVCGATDVKDVTLADDKVDILIVVDNSGSMQEEQDEIARNFLNESGACPIAPSALGDFRRCDDDASDRPDVCRFLNPSPAQLENELAACGFLQILAAYDTDFRVGVVTTDVGACDNRVPSAQGGDDWGFRPQRGCLQPDTAHGARKIIARDDVDSADPAVRDIAGRFSSTLANIRTFGTPVERGLDAVDLFFADDTDRDASCAADRDDFVRDDARLAIVFLSDEEDCSHDDAGPFVCGAADEGCDDRFAEFADDVCGLNGAHFTRLTPANNCYNNLDDLTPVSEYAKRFKALKRDPTQVVVAAIAGGVVDEDGDAVASGCDVGEDGGPAGGCVPLRGGAREDCPDCCLADGGGRYYELVDEMGGTKDSICNESFRTAMIDIAVALGSSDTVRFSEPPSNPDVIVVEENGVVVPRLSGVDCGAFDGFVLLADGRSLRLCGRNRPAAGDSLVVRAPLAGLCTAPLDER